MLNIRVITNVFEFLIHYCIISSLVSDFVKLAVLQNLTIDVTAVRHIIINIHKLTATSDYLFAITGVIGGNK